MDYTFSYTLLRPNYSKIDKRTYLLSNNGSLKMFLNWFLLINFHNSQKKAAKTCRIRKVSYLLK